jgi:hypothetical protein
LADTSLIFNIIARDKTSATFDKIKAGAAVAGAAIGAALIGAAQQAIEKSKLDNLLAAQLGATPAQAKQLGALSGKVYAQGFGDDLTGVNEAIKAAAQNGLIDVKNAGSDAAQSVTKDLLTVGQVVGEDSERVSSAVSQMLRTGMAGSAQEAMDLIVRATQSGVNKSQDLLDTLNEYGTQFRKLGLDGPTAMGLLSQAIKAGARDSDTAADAIKEFSIRAVDGSKTTAQGFKDIGLNAKEMQGKIAAGGDTAAEAFSDVLQHLSAIPDPAKRSQAAVALFGTKAEDLGDSLFAMNMGDAADQMNGMAGATQKAAATASSGAAGWGTLGRQFQMALIDKLNAALPVVNAIFGFLQKNQAVIAPLATALGIFAVAIGIVTVAQWAWNVAMTANPIGVIVVAIGFLVGILIYLGVKTKFFQTIWQAVWGFMKAVGAWFAGPFANFFVMVWNKIVAFAKGVWAAVKLYFGFWKGVYVQIGTWALSAIKLITSKFTSLVNFFKSIPGKIGGALKNMFAPLWNGFRSFVNRLIAGWNGLHFGIPGFSFAGINVPGIEIGTPNLPFLDKGAGMVLSSGLAVIHRGERVTPAARVTPYRSGGDGGGGTLTIRGDGSRVANFLLEILREAIRDKGGDPVKVLSPRGAGA